MKARSWTMKTIGAIAATAALTATILAAPAHANGKHIGEIVEFANNFCPRHTLPTDGRELKIHKNSALFSLLGTNYGGDGLRTFRLPLISKTDDSGRNITTCIVTQGVFPSRS